MSGAQPAERTHEYVDAAVSALDDLLAALVLVRPSRAREAAQAALDTARSALRKASRARGHSATAAARVDEEAEMQRRDVVRLLTTAAVGGALRPRTMEGLLSLREDSARDGPGTVAQVAAVRELTAAYADAYTRVDPGVLARLIGPHVELAAERLDRPAGRSATPSGSSLSTATPHARSGCGDSAPGWTRVSAR
jgi:hypothetical protein